jgi:UDP-N-acetylmuramyl pentapeptide phosphotransferase/UDP-N-acetylglucosamine-1-phosphate transferase
MTLIYAAVALALALWLTHRLCRPGTRWLILDYPNERSLHTHPTPRTGGLAILAAIYAAGALSVFTWPPPLSLVAIAAGGLAIATISFWDDRTGVAPAWRMLVHMSAGVLMMFAGLGLTGVGLPGTHLGVSVLIGMPLSVLFVVWMVNLYNFMDGMDGLAGGMTVIGFASYALFGMLAGDALFVATSLSIAAAAAGFLMFNYPPARIFMGDIGSSLLGFLAAALALWGERDGIVPLWAAMLIFSPFIVDASVTLLQRARRGEKIWQAHKRHYYQRLVQLGWGHKKTMLWEYALMLACAASALWAAQQTPSVAWFILAVWALCYALLILAVTRLEQAKHSMNSFHDTKSSDS